MKLERWMSDLKSKSAYTFYSTKLKYFCPTSNLNNKPFLYLDEELISTLPGVVNILAPVAMRIASQSINSYRQIHYVLDLTIVCDGICGDLNKMPLEQLTAYLDVGSDVLLTMFGANIKNSYFLGFSL